MKLIIVMISVLTLTACGQTTDERIAAYKKCQDAGMYAHVWLGAIECYPPSVQERNK